MTAETVFVNGTVNQVSRVMDQTFTNVMLHSIKLHRDTEGVSLVGGSYRTQSHSSSLGPLFPLPPTLLVFCTDSSNLLPPQSRKKDTLFPTGEPRPRTWVKCGTLSHSPSLHFSADIRHRSPASRREKGQKVRGPTGTRPLLGTRTLARLPILGAGSINCRRKANLDILSVCLASCEPDGSSL